MNKTNKGSTSNYRGVYFSFPVKISELLNSIDKGIKQEILLQALFNYFSEEEYKKTRPLFKTKEEYLAFEKEVLELYGYSIELKKEKQISVLNSFCLNDNIKENIQATNKRKITKKVKKEISTSSNISKIKIENIDEDIINEFDY